ncbi:MAG: tRNA epoxyqueuosine(34) reductase QueG [Acidobacteria bacterium]|nr:tRNA epoxyqueuosine(34) reductase QueG [Acidobacteriota bacterium]
MPGPHDLEAAVAEACRGAGIPAWGAAPALPIPGADAALARWVADGFHAGMAWVEAHRAVRADPRRLFPEALSVLVCVFPCEDAGEGGRLPGVSRFYRGEDYHHRVRRALEGVLDALRHRWPGLRGRVCVDAEPLHERALAVSAGLGWVGRNACLVHPALGSFLCLGEILLNAALPPGEPVADRCGDCRRCLEACPAGALDGQRRVDCRRCVAWHTVENRGVIPRGLKGRLGGMLFGCDRCQEACPYNAGTVPGVGAGGFAGVPRTFPPGVDDLARMSGKAFLRAYGKTALARAGLAGLLRNLVALSAELPGWPGHPVLGEIRRRRPLAESQWREFFDPGPAGPGITG